MQNQEQQNRKLVFWAFTVLTAIVLFMLAYSLLHLNRHWLCANPDFTALHLCIYDFPMN
jgi:hypothetical protein